MKKIQSKELAPLKIKIQTVAEQVSTFSITDSTTLKQGVEMLSKLNSYADSIKAKKELITKPLNEALKNARSMFKPLEEVYDEAVELLREKMSIYQTKEVNARKEAEQAIAARIAPGKGNLTLETAVDKISALPTPDKEVATEVGLVQFRETKVLKITSRAMIPAQYWVVDEAMVLEALKENILVPGAKIEIIQTPVNYR